MNVLKRVLLRPILFHRVLFDITGSVKASLMASQALYWTERLDDSRKGWFYKTIEEWTEEVCLSKDEQQSARKILRETGFWQERLIGVPATCWFRVDFDVLERLVLELPQFAEKPQTSLRETRKHLSLTETTTETTQQAENPKPTPPDFTFKEFKKMFCGRTRITVPNRNDWKQKFEEAVLEYGGVEFKRILGAWLDQVGDRYRDPQRRVWAVKDFFEEAEQFDVPSSAEATPKKFPRLTL